MAGSYITSCELFMCVYMGLYFNLNVMHVRKSNNIFEPSKGNYTGLFKLIHHTSSSSTYNS